MLDLNKRTPLDLFLGLNRLIDAGNYSLVFHDLSFYQPPAKSGPQGGGLFRTERLTGSELPETVSNPRQDF